MKTYRKEKKKYLNSMRRRGRKAWIHMLLLGTLSLGIVIYSVVCTIQMKMQDASTTKRYVGNYVQQRADMINMEVSSDTAMITGLAKNLSEGMVGTDIGSYLEAKRELYDLDFIALYDDETGKVQLAGEGFEAVNRENLMKNERFGQALKQGRCAACMEEDRMVYAIKLDSSDKEETLWAAGSSEGIKSIMTSETFRETSNSYVVDETEQVLLAAGAEENRKLWNFVIGQTGNQELLEDTAHMKTNISNQKGGVFQILLPGHKKYYLAYEPLERNGWTIVTIVSSDLFTRFSDWYVVKMLGNLGIVLFVFGAYFFLLLKSYSEGEKKLEQLAFSDEVTGGINKLEFQTRYQELCKRRIAEQYAIVLMDCVDFKIINKNLGASNGDRLLQYFYAMMAEHLKEEDGEFVARTEMDHFFLCMKETNSQVIRERLNAIVKEINTFHGIDLPKYKIRFRRGISFGDSSESDVTVFQDQARAALKNQGDGNVESCIFFDSLVAGRVQKEKELENQFASSIAEEHFQVYLQPKVSLGKKKVMGAEALVRWNCPGRGQVSPAEFIPVLENDGKIGVLDRYVFEKVCAWLKEQKEQGEELLPISVNLSRNNFFTDNFLEEYVKIAEQYGVETSLIELEITETIFLSDSQAQKVREGIQRMHQYGFRCALDDFGVGFSSLTLIRSFDIDVLKMDRSFFYDLRDEKSRDVISCIVELAEKLNIEIVVEGIETEEQIKYMQMLHCDVVQGYYFSRPLPIKEFEKWVERFNRLYSDQQGEKLPDFYGGGYEHDENADVSEEIL